MSVVEGTVNTGSIVQSQDARTDNGWVSSTTIAQLAATAVAVINTLAALEMSAREYQIANGYYNLALQLRNYWNNTFVPCETAAVAYACSQPLYQPLYNETAGRYIASVKQQFADALNNVVNCANRFCTGLTQSMIKDITIAEAQAIGDAQNYAYRYEEAREEAMDDRRWARIMNALGLGRNLLGDAASYAKTAAGLYGLLGQQAGAGAAGALYALGYERNRNQTVYPTRPQSSWTPNPVSSMQTTSDQGGVMVGAPMDMSMPQSSPLPDMSPAPSTPIMGFAPVNQGADVTMAGTDVNASWTAGKA
ncbi:hypothetical protein [Paraburkholderia dinghuensis]|uniref:Uncharacterized protein n=1 Tax=Paraburkholderia dinghuensis TaxID=2305225 RepID=A0A3N6N771_9BURK|nr:hypothetical protein [Paraburkholderia dinghuensis]RQH06621.1 hypothetical protein D1Y85_12170 [Paraburkholderia dinghuensis]